MMGDNIHFTSAQKLFLLRNLLQKLDLIPLKGLNYTQIL